MNACRAAAGRVLAGELSLEELTEQHVAQGLCTAGCPGTQRYYHAPCSAMYLTVLLLTVLVCMCVYCMYVWCVGDEDKQ